MKPVLVVRHAALEGAGYLGEFLSRQHIPMVLLRIDAADVLPATLDDYSGLVLMGGPMSANDDLPWIPAILELIRLAVAKDLPVLGHCLGAQLMSKALGGQVSRNAHQEIGWWEVQILPSLTARQWFGDLQSFNGFHWHAETFSLPPNSVPLLRSQHCQHQAFALGIHLGLQCHIEMTSELVKSWCASGDDEISAAIDSPAVQSVEQILTDLPLHCFFLQKVAERVYTQWIKGLQL